MRQGRQGAFLLWFACLAVKAEPISPIIASEPASSVVKFLENKGLADLPISNIVPLPAVGSLHSMDLDNPVEGSSLKAFMENQRQGFTFPDGQACEKDAHKLVTDYLFLQRPYLASQTMQFILSPLAPDSQTIALLSTFCSVPVY